MNEDQNMGAPSQEEMTEEQKRAMEAGEGAAPEATDEAAQA